MKVVKLISGILGLIASVLTLYVLFISPSYSSAWYPITATILLIFGSVVMLASNNKALVSISSGGFFVSLLMFFSHVSSVTSGELESGARDIPDYIPDSIEIIGTALILIVTILSVVTVFGSLKKESTNT
jgi:hypothetical protein